MYKGFAENREYNKKHFPLVCDVFLVPFEGISKFIPRLTRFIELLNPGIIIPMHYWSDKYKKEFLDYMEKHGGDLHKYRIVHLDLPDFKYTQYFNTERKIEKSVRISVIFGKKFRGIYHGFHRLTLRILLKNLCEST
jgi:hypothetical protein